MLLVDGVPCCDMGEHRYLRTAPARVSEFRSEHTNREAQGTKPFQVFQMRGSSAGGFLFWFDLRN